MNKKGNGYETQVKPDFVARLAAKEDNSEFVFKPAVPRLKATLLEIATITDINNASRSYKLATLYFNLKDAGLEIR